MPRNHAQAPELPSGYGEETDAFAPCILTSPGDNRVRWQEGQRLQHLFEALCLRNCQDIAVSLVAGEVSFGQLDARANQLARYLRQNRVGSGDVVALLFDRSLESYVSMLAVLKVNAAYVPLDAAFPEDRVSFIFQDAGVSAFLTMSKYAERAKATGVQIHAIDERKKDIGQHDSGPLTDLETHPPTSELAYIIYTSGTTGNPKGVPINHSSICNFVQVAAETYGYQSGDRVYQGLTLAFDFSVEEIWVPLLAGATLVPNEGESNLVGDELTDFLRTQKITGLCCVPTLLATLDPGLDDLRLLIVSGEACPPDIVRRWHRNDRRILNAYGPTEITVTATICELEPDEPVTIGGPLPTYSIAILAPDEARALSQGEVGEIAIGGIGLSPGYLGRDDLTKKAFIDDFLDLPQNSSGRIYRSGDLGRIDDKGRIEYMGRIDSQVKIRGYRIELTEIESQIMQIAGVAQAVVNKYEPEPSVAELVAYYTASDPINPVTPEIVAAELSKALPNFMLPAYIDQLDEIPLLPSDKADRKALPEPILRRGADRPIVEPKTHLERDIACQIADLLGMSEVSVTDDFFDDLGTNSLTLARLSTRIRTQLDVSQISMREIYEARTVRNLATLIEPRLDAAKAVKLDCDTKPASRGAMIATGMAQLAATIAYLSFGLTIIFAALEWVFVATGTTSLYFHAVGATGLLLLVAFLTPVALKWMLIGRMEEENFPAWSWRYLRFWIIRSLIRSHPAVLFRGTPIYTAFLKLMGARIDWSAVILSPPPFAPDMIEIGAQSIISRDSHIAGYRAESGRIVTGKVRIGTGCYVGVGATVDIGTRLVDGAQLGHASAVVQGQTLAQSQSYHGVPASPTQTKFQALENQGLSGYRMAIFAAATQILPLFVLGPAAFLAAHFLVDTDASSPLSTLQKMAAELTALQATGNIALYSATAFLFGAILQLILITILPRLAFAFLKADKEYKLYGIHHALERYIERGSNSKFFNEYFGDSSLITSYLQTIGFRFKGIFQTGSNFGSNQQHDVPFLCEIGHKTMVSDGLIFANNEFSSGSFRLCKAGFGQNTYLGNRLVAVPGAAIGDNVLIGNKTMLPVDGAIRTGIGLLGSPSFEIPRSVERDQQFEEYTEESVRLTNLARKNQSNGWTRVWFLLYRWGALFLAFLSTYFFLEATGLWSPLGLAVAIVLGLAASLTVGIIAERASIGFRKLHPLYCSVYEKQFWAHERYWKLAYNNGLVIFDGTPLKGPILRALGVRVGSGLFDDGCIFTEKSLTEIGDDCTLNRFSVLQPHSLEEGVFKSEPIELGDRVTLGVNAYIHYGTLIGDDSLIDTDSFLMKGETVDAGTLWRGNPAAEVSQGADVLPIRGIATKHGTIGALPAFSAGLATAASFAALMWPGTATGPEAAVRLNIEGIVFPVVEARTRSVDGITQLEVMLEAPDQAEREALALNMLDACRAVTQSVRLAPLMQKADKLVIDAARDPAGAEFFAKGGMTTIIPISDGTCG